METATAHPNNVKHYDTQNVHIQLKKPKNKPSLTPKIIHDIKNLIYSSCLLQISAISIDDSG
jgi:hypothetical protein